MLSEIRLRSKLSDERVKAMAGRKLLPDEIDVVLTGPCRVLKPDGRPLCVYRPKAVTPELRDASWPILETLEGHYTSNRGYAAGSERFKGPSQRSYAMEVDSQILGSFRGQGPRRYCRLTAWTGREVEKWQGLWPLFGRIAEELAEHVPDRYAAQMAEVQKAQPEWIIKGTPFSTITANFTFSTSVHVDKGDLDAGFSTLTVFRQGDYKGGWICFPQYRVAVDMQDCDVLLMDAHEWHGNTEFDPLPKRRGKGQLDGDPGFKRASLVCYYRTDITECGSGKDELERGQMLTERRYKSLIGE